MRQLRDILNEKISKSYKTEPAGMPIYITNFDLTITVKMSVICIPYLKLKFR